MLSIDTFLVHKFSGVSPLTSGRSWSHWSRWFCCIYPWSLWQSCDEMRWSEISFTKMSINKAEKFKIIGRPEMTLRLLRHIFTPIHPFVCFVIKHTYHFNSIIYSFTSACDDFTNILLADFVLISFRQKIINISWHLFGVGRVEFLLLRVVTAVFVHQVAHDCSTEIKEGKNRLFVEFTDQIQHLKFDEPKVFIFLVI